MQANTDYGQHAGDLYGELLLSDETLAESKPASKLQLLPGLAICAIASIAAAWLSDNYGIPIILMGLLIGLALNFVAADPRTHSGLDFASRIFLQIGIVVLGMQVTFAQISALGLTPFFALLAVMAVALSCGILAGCIVRQPSSAGLLAGGATAICGASAALALYGVLGRDRVSQAQFTLTLVGITFASALAMSFYPIIAQQIGLTDRQAGFLIGASIHDVAQAIGGGYAYSDEAGSYATIVKLARVALLAPFVALVSIILAQGGTEAKRLPVWRKIALPWFIAAFLIVVTVNSLATVPVDVTNVSLMVSKTLLLLAVTATAMRSRLNLLMQMGWRALMPVLGATLGSFGAALLFSKILL
jgi:uncharacterized integral membrane protein (TIGR00698 family)